MESTNPDQFLDGRYQIISRLAAGGFGQTFLAQDMHLPGQPQCVIKQLKPKKRNPENLETARRLFDTEANVLWQLGNHDQIPRLLAHFEQNQEFYLAQEFIDGDPLSKELIKNQPWREARVIALLQDILYVLSFVHQQNVIHRDIKPSNLIRRRQDGRIVLIDFGAVKQVRTELAKAESGETSLTISIGTPGYMPNEQLAGRPQFSSDVYAVGIIGIQALTGRSPKKLKVDSRTSEIQWRDELVNRDRSFQVSPEFAAILDRMVLYDFRSRYQTAVQALEALRSLPSHLTESVPGFDAELPPSPLGADLKVEWIDLASTTPVSSTAPLEQPTPSNLTEPLDSPAPLNSTAPLEEPAPPPQDLPKSAPPVTLAKPPHNPVPTHPQFLTQRQSFNPWPFFAVVASVAVTFFVTKTFIPPEIIRDIVTIYKDRDLVRQDSEDSIQLSSANQAQQTDESSSKGSNAETSNSSTGELSVKELLSKADQLREEGKYQEALTLYDEVIERDTDIPQAQWGRCYSLNKLQQPTEALSACDEALALKPDYPEALSSKGYALNQQNNQEEALLSFEEAINMNPDFPEAWSNQGMALLKLDRPAEALSAFEEATALDSDYAEAWANRGVALWELERYDEAIASFDKALEIEPDSKNARNLRQQAEEQLGR